MKRVLVIGPVPPPQGGIASVIQDHVNSELANSYTFEIFPRQPSLPEYLRSSFTRNIFRLRRFVRFLITLLRRRYCLVHIHSPDTAFIGTVIFIALAKLARTPVLLHQHGTDWQSFYPDSTSLRKTFIRLGLRLPNHVIVLYELWEEEIRRIAPNAQVQVLRNFAHDIEPPPEGVEQAVRERLELSQVDFLVLTVGSVGHRKGSFDILKAAEEIMAKDHDIKFVFIGDEEKPGEFEQVKQALQMGGLDSSVFLLGEVDRNSVNDFLAAADMFLLPSYYEGMPISLIEAMRSGLAIITTPVAGVPEMLTGEESCIFVQPGASDQIAAALLRLKNDSVLRDTLARNARAAFEDRFEFSRGIEQLKQIYSSLERAQ